MSPPEQGDDARREDERYAAYMRLHFGVEPHSDRPGLFTWDGMPTLRQSDEDALFAAYMRRYFPGRAG